MKIMKRGFVLICAVTSLTLGPPANAQTQAAPKVLTYQEAVKIGLRNGILLNQQKNNLDLNQMQKYSNILGLGPTLSANASAQRVSGNTFNQNELKVVNGLFDQVSGSLNANWNLFNGFSQVNKARQFSSVADAQEYYINRTAQDVINTVSSQYLQVLLDGELLKIAKENFAVLEKQLNQIQEQVKLGARSPVDEYNQDSQTKAAEIKALQAEINLISDRSLLTQTLLLDPTEDFDVVKPDWDVNAINMDNIALPALIDLSLKNRGDYLRAVKNEEAARYGTAALRASMFPTLSAYGGMYSAYNQAHGDPTTRPFAEQFRVNNLKKYAGFQLYIPIFGGGQNLQNRTNYVQQKVLYQNNAVLRKNAEILVKTDVLKAYKNFELVKKTFSLTLAQLQSAEIAFQYETERYNLGVTDFVTYLNANRVLVQSQTDKAQAEYRLVFQKILLSYAAGTLKPEDIQ